ncbi:MAG TPA: NAD(P)/FAD-dependent oxidoreductase [Verrucomicrobiae bacterium]|nr:NAD(P)/FAD-dependent oxidoreductase [Verrucomicrobiae bacterium]
MITNADVQPHRDENAHAKGRFLRERPIRRNAEASGFLDVAIFGAGIAGLTTAIALQARGHRCRIYERSRQAHEAGMGFILLPEGTKLLQSVGVRFTDDLHGIPLDRYCHRNSAGEIVHQEFMPAGSRSLRRCDLIGALLRALPASECLVYDAELKRLECDEGGIVSSCVLRSGVTIQADLYIAADGVRSRGRKALFPDWPAPASRVLEIVGMVRCDQVRRWTASNFNKFHAPEGGLAVGVLPVDSHHVVWYLQFDTQRFSTPGESGPERATFVNDLVRAWAGPVPRLLELTDFAQAHIWIPVDTDLIPRFHHGNLALVGDSAHPLLPFSSQGLSSAIADAVALADLCTPREDLGRVLAAYSDKRRAQCNSYIAKGRDLMRRFLAAQGADSVGLPIA